MMVVVIDTNIFVGACLGNGIASDVIAGCLHGEHKVLMGSTLFSEYEDVLAREAIFQNSRLDSKERDELFDIFVSTTTWTKVYYNWRPNLVDEGDNHLIELAMAGNADCIVARNIRDFTQMDLLFPELKIVLPEVFLEECKK